ncbi:MAG: hypothetical protein GKR93_03465 [Gammaproteobacteria bacterium]|nr:hypothetical protein [Gammaproteobacteria bacterium]
MEKRIEKKVIKLREPLTESTEKALLSELLALEGVSAAELADQRIKIRYDFPQICFAEIWSLLNSYLDKNKLGLIQRGCLNLVAYMQENEKEHLFNPAHWQFFVRDIHVHHHALRQATNANNQKHLWRKHQLTHRSE